MTERPPHERWPKLTGLAQQPDTRRGLRRLLKDCGYVYTPAFLDSTERAIQDLEEWAAGDNSRLTLAHSLSRHITQQSKYRLCLERMMETCAAAWLAQYDALAPGLHESLEASSVIDLLASVDANSFGVEVKSDFDGFEAEFMYGASQGDPDAIHPKLQEHFGREVRTQLRWIGGRPPRDGWGPIRKQLAKIVAQKIPEAPPLAPGEQCRITARLERKLDQCMGLELVVDSRPLVNVSMMIGADGWEEVARRIRAHAEAKSEKTDTAFVLLYVTQPPQASTINALRLARASQEFRDSHDLPNLLGVFHLTLSRGGDSVGTARGFVRKCWTAGPTVAKRLGVGGLPSSQPSKISGSVQIG